MGWNGSGVFNRIFSWVADAAAGIDISASRMDTDTDDITANGFGNCLTRDGQGTATANLPMNNFRHTGCGAGVANSDYATVAQVGVMVSPYPSGGDDTAALQAWINSIQTSGKIGFWQPGNFQNTTAALAITAGVKIVGAGNDKTILGPGAAFSGIAINSASPVQLADFAVIYGSAANSGTTGISKTAPTGQISLNDRFENIYINGAYTGLSIDRANLYTVDKVLVDSTGGNAFVLADTTNGDEGDGCLTNSAAAVIGANGVFYTGGGGLKIINFKVSNATNGIVLDVAPGITSGDLLISNSSLEGLSNAGIVIERQANTASWTNVVVDSVQVEAPVYLELPTDATGAWLYNLSISNPNWEATGSGVAIMCSIDSTFNFSCIGGVARSNGNAGTAAFTIGSAASNGLIVPPAEYGTFTTNTNSGTNVNFLTPITSGDVTVSSAGVSAVANINGTVVGGTTGSGKVVFATGPTLTTPALGAATATTINGMAITPAGAGATLAVATGKTLTAANTLTLSGTDGSTLNVGTGGALGTAAYVNTGTSGATVPLLNGGGNFSAAVTFGFSLASGFLNSFQNTHASAGDAAILIGVGAHGSDSTSTEIQFYDGTLATACGNISRNGASAVAYNTSSDIRGKPNRELLSSELARSIIDQLKIWDFDRDGNAIRGVGVIAQEAYEIHPSLAHRPLDDAQWWATEKAAPVPFLVKYVQDLNAELSCLRGRLTAVEDRLR